MSHFVNYECKVKNLDYLKQALTEMGYQYSEKVTITDYYNKKRYADLAVVREGQLLPIGWTTEGEELKLYADWFNTGVNQRQFTDRISQLNSKMLVQEACEQEGWYVDLDEIVENEQGEIEIVAVRYA